MLCLSQTTGYAIRALSFCDAPGGEPQLLRSIAERAEIPYAYLAKRMPDLAAAGLVSTKRGMRGGIILARPPEEITLLEISEAVEARQWLGRCLLGLDSCSDERSCPTHAFWKEYRREIEKILRETNLADVRRHEEKLHGKFTRAMKRAAAAAN